MLEQLILYFVCKTKGHITKTQLVKFLYLADLYAVKWTGKQITDLDWFYYNHGPWTQDIDAALERMDDITLESAGQAMLVGIADESLWERRCELPKGMQLMLENIRREWAGSGDKLEELLKYVYATAPMIAAKKHHQPEDQAPLNLQLERDKLFEELGV